MATIEKEKALDVVRQMVADGQVSQEVAEKYFPELKESEGERTRKYIINHLQEHLKTVREFLNNGMSAPFSCEEIKMLEASVAWLEKQGEQKPADKFEIGDLITNGILVGKIDRIYEWGYHVYFGDYYSDVPDVENWHKWTIQDAKDGDVLAAHECLVLFKEIDGLNIKCYCTYHYMGCNPSFYVNTLQNKTAFYPATKEQCDILMKAMTDAGYTFDFESKELKKIEEEVNGEDYGIDSLYHAQRILEKTLGKVDGYQSDDGILEHKCAISAVKKLYEQKPNWSEEDGKNLEKTIWYVEKGGKLVFAKTDKLVSWLKSLRPQWKPSEAQISALDFAIDCTVYPEFQDKRKVLIELLEQLKQL